jgi:hypothetical protein
MVSTEPTEIQLREISEADQETPFDMINQIKYRPVAIYESEVDNALEEVDVKPTRNMAKWLCQKLLPLAVA